MSRPVCVLVLVLLGGRLLSAQQPPTPNTTTTAQGPIAAQSFDRQKVATAIHDSYYHPDKLTGLDCMVAFDWPAFFKLTNLDPNSDRAKAIQALKIQSHALRDKPTTVKFDWGTGTLDTKDQLEGGLKQVVGGFYEMYWPMIAGSPAGNASDLSKIEPLPDGEAKVTFVDADTTVIMTLDKGSMPTHYTLDGAAMKGSIDPHYVPSPSPVKGDLRRLSELNVKEQMGESNFNVNVALNYQTLDGYQVPKHVMFEIVGSLSMEMDFTGCSVAKP